MSFLTQIDPVYKRNKSKLVKLFYKNTCKIDSRIYWSMLNKHTAMRKKNILHNAKILNEDVISKILRELIKIKCIYLLEKRKSW